MLPFFCALQPSGNGKIERPGVSGNVPQNHLTGPHRFAVAVSTPGPLQETRLRQSNASFFCALQP